LRQVEQLTELRKGLVVINLTDPSDEEIEYVYVPKSQHSLGAFGHDDVIKENSPRTPLAAAGTREGNQILLALGRLRSPELNTTRWGCEARVPAEAILIFPLEEKIVPRDIKMSSSLCYGRT
jgi:hypothetical protein